jgi:hypothetical protein
MRACGLVRICPATEVSDRMGVGYRSGCTSWQRRSIDYGYRRIHVLLRREGWQINWKRAYRLYREAGLAVRRRVGP